MYLSQVLVEGSSQKYLSITHHHLVNKGSVSGVLPIQDHLASQIGLHVFMEQKFNALTTIQLETLRINAVLKTLDTRITMNRTIQKQGNNGARL